MELGIAITIRYLTVIKVMMPSRLFHLSYLFSVLVSLPILPVTL